MEDSYLQFMPPDDGPTTLLVIEDEAAVRTVVRRALESATCTVVEAENGEEGLRLLEGGTPEVDVVITDLTMPGIDGYEILQVLAELRPRLPVIVMTANPGRPLLLARARGILLKPFDPGALRLCVLPLLERAREMRARAQQQRADAQDARALAAFQRRQAAEMHDRNADLVAAVLALRAKRKTAPGRPSPPSGITP